LYAAKSTEDKHGSIPTQLDDCRAMAEREDWTIVGEHKDEAKSAYHGDRGPGLASAREQAVRVAAEGDGCILVAQHSDRFARGDGLQAQHLAELWFAVRREGVELRSVQDDSTFTNPLLIMALGERNTEDSRRKGLAVAAGMKRSAQRGKHNGRAPYGYRHEGQGADSVLGVEPADAAVVQKLYADYVFGESLRAITQALNAAGTPSPRGARWQRSVVSRILANVVYVGKLAATGEDGEPLPGAHDAIVDADVWARAQAIRAGHLKRKCGRHADGGHLLVRGLFRCRCGSAMKPMNARPGLSRASYHCSGRIEHGADFCSQPRIARELVDEPILAALLDSYVDLDAMRQRIEQRLASELTVAREALSHAERDAAAVDYDRRLGRATRGWQEDVIDDAEYARQRTELDDERAGAQAALAQAQERVRQIEQSGPMGDAEAELLEYLAAVKRAAAATADVAPNLNALQNVIGQMFERVQLVRSGEWPRIQGDGFIPMHDDVPAVVDGEDRYWLLPVMRWESVDTHEFEPIRRELPVPPPLVAKP
jgi:DNA invertase Pin-like site-specific DNA recombinase